MRLEDPRDSDKRYFRSSDRLICQNGDWYFLTREGEQGPYPSREAAREATDYARSGKGPYILENSTRFLQKNE